jgi:phosphonate transport system substrate-binding protein
MKWPTHRTVAALFAAVIALLVIFACTRSAASGGSGGGSRDPHVLVFAAVPSDRLTALWQAHQPILELLKKETGMEVQFHSGTDYAAIIEGLRDGKIDVAALGPFSYVLAMQRGAPITVVASRMYKKGQAPGYRAYGITWVGSPIKSLADFRGKRICFVDHDSTSGYLYPSAGLLAMGIDPDKDTIPIFVGRHDASAIAVANHQCDAGFALDRVVDPKLIEQGHPQPGQIITVWKSETIPSPPIVIANHLPPKLRQQLTTALQDKANADYLRANGFCQGKCAIADGGEFGYQSANDADYNGIRDICRRIQNRSCTEG